MPKTFRAPRHYARLAALLLVLPLIEFTYSASANGDSPTPVTTITSASASSTSITLTWSVSQDTGRIAGFDVMDGPGQELANFYPPDLTGTITGLTPSTTYNLTFTTFSLAPPPTDAVFTDVALTVTTLPPGTAPPSSVAPTSQSLATALKPLTVAASSVGMSWTPALGAAYLPLNFGIIVCQDGKRTCLAPLSLPANARSTTIRGLKSRTGYEVFLQTYLGSGMVTVSRNFSTK